MPRSMHLHRNQPESEKYIWIIQNLKKSRFFYISITRQLSFVQPNTRLSPSLRPMHAMNKPMNCMVLGNKQYNTETVEFLERSLASYCCSMIGCCFFLDIIGSQKRIATYNFWRPVIKASWASLDHVHEPLYLVHKFRTC